LWFLRQIDQLIRPETAKPQAMNFRLRLRAFSISSPNSLPLWTVKREERLQTRRELRQELLSEAHRPPACGLFLSSCVPSRRVSIPTKPPAPHSGKRDSSSKRLFHQGREGF